MGQGDKYDMHFKILILGDSRVGKSTLVQQFVGEPADDYYCESLGVDFKEAILNFLNHRIKLCIYDACGNPKVDFLLKPYLSIVQGAFVCFDVTNPLSFYNIERHIKKIKEQHHDIPIFLIGCKSDLSHTHSVETEKIKELVAQLGLPYFETSGRKAINVQEPFTQIMQQMYFLSLQPLLQKIIPTLEQHLHNYLQSTPSSNNVFSLFAGRSARENLLIEEYKKKLAALSQSKSVHEVEAFFRAALDIIERADNLFAAENPFLSMMATSPLSKTLGKTLFDLGKTTKDFIDLSALVDVSQLKI